MKAERTHTVQLNKDIIISSFEASRGSTIAQALYERMYALAHTISLDQIMDIFMDTVFGFDDDEMEVINRSMGISHTGNRDGQQHVKDTRRYTSSSQGVLVSVMPHPNIEGDSTMDILEERILKLYQLETIDQALINLWNTRDSERIIHGISNISAALGLFEKRTWWKNLSKEEQKRMINRGNELLEVAIN